MSLSYGLVSLARPQPLKEGEKRQWEPWELPWIVGISSAMILYTAATYFQPNRGQEELARIEALQRMAVTKEE